MKKENKKYEGIGKTHYIDYEREEEQYLEEETKIEEDWNEEEYNDWNEDKLWNTIGLSAEELKEVEFEKSEMIRKLPKWKKHVEELEADKEAGKKVNKWVLKNVKGKIFNFDKNMKEIDKKIRSLKWHVRNDEKTKQWLIQQNKKRIKK